MSNCKCLPNKIVSCEYIKMYDDVLDLNFKGKDSAVDLRVHFETANQNRYDYVEKKTIGNIEYKENQLILYPQSRALIPTGIKLKLPNEYDALIKPRSGYSFKTGLIVFLGTIDEDYVGELFISVANYTNESIIVNHGDRIAQLQIYKKDFVNLVNVDFINENTERGDKGFGSSGIN